MDSLDIGILRETLASEVTSPLDQNPRKSYSAISRKLKVDENTVRNRIRKLRESGFLRGWRIAINPNLIDQKMAQVWFDVRAPHTKREAIRDASTIPGVAVVKDLYGDSVCLVLYHDGEKAIERVKELIANLAGSSNVVAVEEPFPRCDIILKGDDWRIIHSLQKEPAKTRTLLSNELGLSAKTIHRRLRKLIEGDALYQVAELSPKSLSGSIVCGLLVFYKDPGAAYQTRRTIHSRIGEQLIFANTDDPGHGYYAVVLANIASVGELLEWVSQLPNVKGARIDIVQDVISVYSVYEEQLERLLVSRHYAPAVRAT
jgi:DNA-binding Lrp family transcriptional regulator